MRNIIEFLSKVFKWFVEVITFLLDFLNKYSKSIMFIVAIIFLILGIIYYIDNRRYVRAGNKIPDGQANAEYDYRATKLESSTKIEDSLLDESEVPDDESIEF